MGDDVSNNSPQTVSCSLTAMVWLTQYKSIHKQSKNKPHEGLLLQAQVQDGFQTATIATRMFKNAIDVYI